MGIMHIITSLVLPIVLIACLFIELCTTSSFPPNDHPNALRPFHAHLPRAAWSAIEPVPHAPTSKTNTSASPTQSPFSATQPRLDPKGVGTIVFGCINVIIAVLALLATLGWCRRNAENAVLEIMDGNDLELGPLPNTESEGHTATDQVPINSERGSAPTAGLAEDTRRPAPTLGLAEDMRRPAPTAGLAEDMRRPAPTASLAADTGLAA